MKKLFAVAMAASSFAAANAQLLIGSGFENGAVGAGLATAQSTQGSLANKPWLTDNSSTTVANQATGIYSNTQAFGGSKSLRITRGTGASGTTWFFNDVSSATFSPIVPTIVGSARFFVDASVANNSYFGLDAYALGTGLGGFALAGDGTVIAKALNTSNAVAFFRATTTTGANLTYQKGAWNLLEVYSFYNATETSVTTVYALNGNLLYTGATGSSLLGLAFTGTAATLHYSDCDIFTGSIALGAASSASRVAYVDDYKVQAVPEPSTYAAMALGLAVVIRRRRK